MVAMENICMTDIEPYLEILRNVLIHETNGMRLYVFGVLLTYVPCNRKAYLWVNEDVHFFYYDNCSLVSLLPLLP